jgi:hypothetical protein
MAAALCGLIQTTCLRPVWNRSNLDWFGAGSGLFRFRKRAASEAKGGLSIGGMTYKNVSEQGPTHLRLLPHFLRGPGGAQIKSRGGFVKTEITMTNMLGDQPALWQDRVMLDEDFFRALSDRPEPGCAMDRANPGRMRLARIDTLRHTRPCA